MDRELKFKVSLICVRAQCFWKTNITTDTDNQQLRCIGCTESRDIMVMEE